MSEENKKITAPKTSKEEEIQKVLQQVPDDLLISLVADRIRRAPAMEVEEVVETVTQQTSFSGPIPPPDILIEYGSAGPDFPDRIIGMAESQQKHRQEVEKDSLEGLIKAEKRGQIYALIVSLSVILGSLYLIDSGKEISGLLLAGSTLIGLAYVFITGRKKDERESV